jgi:hypothetical protein
LQRCRARPNLKPLAGLPIRSLILDSTADIQSHRRKGRVSDTTVAHAAGLPQLQHLSLRYAPSVTAKGLAGLAGHPTLESLVLAHSQKVASVEAMQAVARMPALQAIDLGGVLNLGGDHLAALAQSRSLRAVRLDVRGLKPGDLAHLAALSGLEHLLLEHTLPRGAAAPISADDLRALADLPLSTLQLPASLPVDVQLASAIAHTGARHVVLQRPVSAAIPLDHLAPLAANPSLRTLVTPHRQAAAVAETLGCAVLPSVPYQSDDATQPLQKGIWLES